MSNNNHHHNPKPPPSPPSSKNAYATLLTRPNYLAGALLLAYTLHKHSPSTPLIIMYTPSTLPSPALHLLTSESHLTNSILHPVPHLHLPPPSPSSNPNAKEETGMVAERFIDTWTKLRVFQLQSLGFDKICFLDADMMIFRDPSPLVFGVDVSDCELRATHVCVCNLDGDAWAPDDWTVENCAYSHVRHDEQRDKSAEEQDLPEVIADSPTRGIMNTSTLR